MNTFIKSFFAFISTTLTLSTSTAASALCGFMVPRGLLTAKTSEALVSKSSHVVLMREGGRTVLSMRPHYQGPAEDFAMVLPVPELLKKDNVKTLPARIFDDLEASTAPGLKEFDEISTCHLPRPAAKPRGKARVRVKMSSGTPKHTSSSEEVIIEGEFVVGEYEIAILSARESHALEQWLSENGYLVPKGASKVLAPYIAQGMYFFVAKVNADKVTFDSKGNALLSPLRFHYHSHDFSLPVRLGLLNADGEQELLIHILSRHGRYEVANQKNVLIPTDLVVPETTTAHLDAFYNALLDYTWSEHPGAIITEHAWDNRTCEHCIVPRDTPKDYFTFGWDQLVEGTHEQEIRVALVDDAIVTRYPNDVLSNEIEHYAFGKTPHLTQCYSTFLDAREDSLSGRMALTAEITPQGTFTALETPWNDLGDRKLEACVVEEISKWKLDSRLPEKTTSVELLLRFKHEVRRVRRRVTTETPWTVTRLRARYTEETMTEDLVFQQAPSISGGFDAPKGRKSTLTTHRAMQSKANRFQARYLLLYPSSSAPTRCPAGESPEWSWRSLPGKRSTTAVITPTEARKPHALSKAIQKAANEQLEHQTSLTEAKLEEPTELGLEALEHMPKVHRQRRYRRR